jgi:hypothetical protein
MFPTHMGIKHNAIGVVNLNIHRSQGVERAKFLSLFSQHNLIFMWISLLIFHLEMFIRDSICLITNQNKFRNGVLSKTYFVNIYLLIF